MFVYGLQQPRQRILSDARVVVSDYSHNRPIGRAINSVELNVTKRMTHSYTDIQNADKDYVFDYIEKAHC